VQAPNSNQQESRIQVLDFLRGIAVLGILIINIENFAYPASFSPYLFGFASEIDQNTRFWVYYLFQGKFFTLFAILFGVSFYLMLERLAERYQGLDAIDIYSRRLLVLFFIGIAHAYFIWDGDILHHYAVCGLFLFPLRSFSQKQLFSVIALLMGSMLFNANLATDRNIEQSQDYAEAIQVAEGLRTEAQHKAVRRWERRTSERNVEYYLDDVEERQGDYLDNVAANAESIKILKGQLFYENILFKTLMLMTIGMFLYRSGIFQDYRSWSYYWPISISLLAISMTLAYDRYYHWSYEYLSPTTSLIKGLMYSVVNYFQGVSYLLVLNGVFQIWLKPKAVIWICNIGRMALSNYILQSLICALIFYGYAGNMVNQVSRSELLAIIPIVWFANFIFSQLWLRYHRQGPLEKIWRKWSLPRQHKQVQSQTA